MTAQDLKQQAPMYPEWSSLVTPKSEEEEEGSTTLFTLIRKKHKDGKYYLMPFRYKTLGTDNLEGKKQAAIVKAERVRDSEVWFTALLDDNQDEL